MTLSGGEAFGDEEEDEDFEQSLRVRYIEYASHVEWFVYRDLEDGDVV